MKKSILTISVILIVISAMLFSSCAAAKGGGTVNSAGDPAAVSGSTAQTSDINVASSAKDMFTDRDFEIGYDASSATAITLAGSTAQCDDETVVVSGGTVTITQTGVYIISGTLDDGMIIVDVDKAEKPQIVLNGVTINSGSSAAIYVKQDRKSVV